MVSTRILLVTTAYLPSAYLGFRHGMQFTLLSGDFPSLLALKICDQNIQAWGTHLDDVWQRTNMKMNTCEYYGCWGKIKMKFENALLP